MDTNKKIIQLVKDKIPDAVVDTSDYKHDGVHFVLTVTSSQFHGMPLVEQHRVVYSALQSLLESGEVHALKIKTRLPES